MITDDNENLVGSTETSISDPKICTRCQVDLSSRTSITLNTKADGEKASMEHLYMVSSSMIC